MKNRFRKLAAAALAVSFLLVLTACSAKKKEIDLSGVTQNPVVTITMQDGGVIKAELYPQVAPNTVCNFISLINKGYYSGTNFHRIISGFMIQGGTPGGAGSGGPGYTIDGEFTSNGFQNDLLHTRGVVSMARGNEPNTAGSQFFIVHEDSDWLNGEYAAFGKVTEGMEVVDRIAAVQTDVNGRPADPQTVATITVETFGFDYPEPKVNK